MESDRFFELIVTTLLIVLVVFGLGVFRSMLRKQRKLNEKCLALLKEVELAKAAKLETSYSESEPSVRIDEVTARLTKLVEESQRRAQDAHIAAQRAHDELVAANKEHSERLLKDLETTQALLRSALERNDRLAAENVELSKEIYALKANLAILKSLRTKRPAHLPSDATKERCHPLPLLPIGQDECVILQRRTRMCHFLYGDEINLTASIPDKPFDYLSDEIDVQTKDKRLYKKQQQQQQQGNFHYRFCSRSLPVYKI